MKYCEKCGTQLTDDVKFCPNCGQAVGKMDNSNASKPKTRKSGNSVKMASSSYDVGSNLTTSKKLGLGLAIIFAGIVLLAGIGNGTFFVSFASICAIVICVMCFKEKIGSKYVWYIVVATFIGLLILIGATADSSDKKSQVPQETEITKKEESNVPKQAEKKEIPKVLFENGYQYSTSFRVNRKEGYGISCNYKYIIKIFKDGTKEISFVNQTDDGSPSTQGTYSCSIDKKSGSYRDVAATWYEIKYKSSTSWGGKVHYGESTIYVDEEGNVIMLNENGNNKDIYEAIATKDCRYGKLKKEILTKNVFRCKTCGKEYDPGKEPLYSEEYCYNDYPQTCNSCGKTYTINTDGSYACKGTCSNCSEKHRNARLYREVTGRDY